jgi:CRISPR/Cas system-associated exonuclease Cas4 (RecB family)
MIYPPGTHSLTAREYHSADGVSNSLLNRLWPTPAHFKAAPKPSTNPMEFGECLHSLLLDKEEKFHIQPDTYDSPDGNKKWNNNANLCRQWNHDHSDRPILTKEGAGMVRTMSSKIMSHPWCSRAMDGAVTEQAMFVMDPPTGLMLKCKADLVPAKGRCKEINPIVDVKTCVSAEKFQFRKVIQKRGYHRQAALYLYIARLLKLDVNAFVFIAIEKSDPYEVAVYDLDPESVEQGLKEIRRRLNIYKHCLDTGEWPGYNTEPELITLPDFGFDLELE